MIELLEYSSNPDSKLNETRRQLWSSRYMLECETEEPGKYGSTEFWDKVIRRDVEKLQMLAREIRNGHSF